MKSSVVSVWTEFGHRTGFIIDKEGLILTNQRVIGPSQDIAVQLDEKRKVPAILLAVDPTDIFPLDAIKEVASAKKFDTSRYVTNVDDFTVTFMTPTLKYRIETETEREAAKTRDKRNNKAGSVQGTFRPFEDIRGWREYTGEYKPILQIRATPELSESFWGSVGRSVAASYGLRVRAKLRFKTDFYRIRLLCGDKEVEPIHPAKIAHLLNEQNYLISVNDATYEGFYSYPADAINPSCGKVTLELFSEKKPNEAKRKILDQKTINKISEDFMPYLNKRSN